MINSRSESPDYVPAWSPEGTRLAFASERNGNTDIYIINKDGTGLTRLTTSPKLDFSPAWSPDGTKISFSGTSQDVNTHGIYVMKAKPESETNRPKRLTSTRNPGFESD